MTPGLAFDKTKPFYALVVAALAQTHGLIEISSRGVYAELKSRSPTELDEFLRTHHDAQTAETMRAILSGGLTTLLGKQKLDATLGADAVKVDVNELGREIVTNHKPALEYFNRISAGGLLILAWEITEASHTFDPLWEFLRHCRNAAAHMGRFNFLHGEPKRAADWKGVSIISTLQGTPLFPEPPVKGFMGPGDVLHLLADIEGRFL